jgi:BMFP domain-containing protein YqiC
MLTPEDLEQIRSIVTTAVTTAVDAAETGIQEFTRDIETNLLAAFHGYARGQTARLHTAEVTAADLAQRVAALEDRMLNLETRRPPQP